MANRMKGITVEIAGCTTGLDKALKSVNTTFKSIQAQMKDVQKLLKPDSVNTELVFQYSCLRSHEMLVLDKNS